MNLSFISYIIVGMLALSFKANSHPSSIDSLSATQKQHPHLREMFSNSFQQGQLPDMSGAPRSSFGAVYHDGYIYVIGGHQGHEHTYPPESFSNRASRLNLATNHWEELAPRPHAAHGLTLGANGKYIYAFGGFAYSNEHKPKWQSLDVIDRYDISENRWTTIDLRLPHKRSSNIAAAIKNKIYLIGGWNSTPKFKDDYDGVFWDSIDVFDTESETITTLDIKLPLKRRAFSGFVRDQKIYLAGGISEGASHFELLDSFVEFNPTAQSFRNLAPLPFKTFAPGLGSLGQNAFVFGGMYQISELEYDYVQDIHQYDFNTNSWSLSPLKLLEAKGFSQVVKWDNVLAILGGHSYFDNTDSPVNTVETLTIENKN